MFPSSPLFFLYLSAPVVSYRVFLLSVIPDLFTPGFFPPLVTVRICVAEPPFPSFPPNALPLPGAVCYFEILLSPILPDIFRGE